MLAHVITALLFYIEPWIRQGEVGLALGEALVVEGVALLDPAADAAVVQVHLGQPPGGIVQLLPVDAARPAGACLCVFARRQAAPVAVARGVGLEELHRLHAIPAEPQQGP